MRIFTSYGQWQDDPHQPTDTRPNDTEKNKKKHRTGKILKSVKTIQLTRICINRKAFFYLNFAPSFKRARKWKKLY